MLFVAGTYAINWLNNVINGHMSPNQAFKNTPLVANIQGAVTNYSVKQNTSNMDSYYSTPWSLTSGSHEDISYSYTSYSADENRGSPHIYDQDPDGPDKKQTSSGESSLFTAYFGGIFGDLAKMSMEEVKNPGFGVKFVSKWGMRLGWAGEAISILNNVENFRSDPSYMNIAKLQVSISSASLNLAGPLGSFGSFINSGVDLGGGYNKYYREAENIEMAIIKAGGDPWNYYIVERYFPHLGWITIFKK